eukprot:scaffold34567_cov66-Cyclotella_meneghiniana.AAC.5
MAKSFKVIMVHNCNCPHPSSIYLRLELVCSLVRWRYNEEPPVMVPLAHSSLLSVSTASTITDITRGRLEVDD